ncbi:hypothetical protein PGQ11_014450 [Apiospora arundinis]|uniref:Uncharacterized protein n=1 Tax=Apiospora arundinis TaxID=335852 RepID=A0ABR2HSE3_9PEZI
MANNSTPAGGSGATAPAQGSGNTNAAQSVQGAHSGPTTRAAAARPTAAGTAPPSQAAAPQPVTSGELPFRPMRLYQRRVRARAIMNRILDDSAFVHLDEDQQALVREQIEECIKDDINKFFDESAPRSLYPYQEHVMAAIRTVFAQNLKLFTFDEEEYEVDQIHRSDTFPSEEQEEPNRVDDSVLDELFDING